MLDPLHYKFSENSKDAETAVSNKQKEETMHWDATSYEWEACDLNTVILAENTSLPTKRIENMLDPLHNKFSENSKDVEIIVI